MRVEKAVGNENNPRQISERGLLICAIALAAAVLVAPGANARPGDSDPSFGVNGRAVADVVTFANAFPTSMAIDSQGRIVVVGIIPRPFSAWPAVARFNPNGTLDQTFGQGGIVRPMWERDWPVGSAVPSSGGETATISGVAVDRGGRIVLGGNIPGPVGAVFTIGRLLEDGEPDPSFSGDGLLTVGGSGDGPVFGGGVALDGDGRILLAGTTLVAGVLRLTTLRANEAGALEWNFVAASDAGFGESSAGRAIAIDRRGRILVAGTARIAGDENSAVVRLDSDGRPDPGFGLEGLATLDFGPSPTYESAADITLDPFGRLVLVGSTGSQSDARALVGRLLPDGAPDNSFASGGTVVLDPPSPAEGAGVAIDRDGRILVAGTQGEAGGEKAFLARLGADGVTDPSFGENGLVDETYGAAQARGAVVVVDWLGRYLLGGGAFGSGPKGFALARYLSTEGPGKEGLGRAGRCHGRRATVVGSAARDRLRGTPGRDVIASFGGNDRIHALGGNDLVCAGAGRDLVWAGAGDDAVFGARGDDRLLGQAGRDRLRGGRGSDRLYGGLGRDSVRGGRVRALQR